MRTLVLLVLGVGLTFAAEARGQDVKKDRDRLQGTWQIVAVVSNGSDVTERFGNAVQLKFSDDTFRMEFGAFKGRQGTVKLDPSKKIREIDITLKAQGEAKEKTVVGIYAFDGDYLKLCLALPGSEDRPTTFMPALGSNWTAFTLLNEKDQ
jgi:uncharacterized protein (TIGR03067 family)